MPNKIIYPLSHLCHIVMKRKVKCNIYTLPQENGIDRKIPTHVRHATMQKVYKPPYWLSSDKSQSHGLKKCSGNFYRSVYNLD